MELKRGYLRWKHVHISVFAMWCRNARNETTQIHELFRYVCFLPLYSYLHGSVFSARWRKKRDCPVSDVLCCLHITRRATLERHLLPSQPSFNGLEKNVYWLSMPHSLMTPSVTARNICPVLQWHDERCPADIAASGQGRMHLQKVSSFI